MLWPCSIGTRIDNGNMNCSTPGERFHDYQRFHDYSTISRLLPNDFTITPTISRIPRRFHDYPNDFTNTLNDFTITRGRALNELCLSRGILSLEYPLCVELCRKQFGKHLISVEKRTKKKISLCNHCINDCKGRWSEWRDSNSRHPGPKRDREFFLTFLAPFNTFIHSSRWYSELSSPLIPPVFSVVVVKTVVKNDCPSSRIRFGFHRYCGQNCGQAETAQRSVWIFRCFAVIIPQK